MSATIRKQPKTAQPAQVNVTIPGVGPAWDTDVERTAEGLEARGEWEPLYRADIGAQYDAGSLTINVMASGADTTPDLIIHAEVRVIEHHSGMGRTTFVGGLGRYDDPVRLGWTWDEIPDAIEVQARGRAGADAPAGTDPTAYLRVTVAARWRRA